MVSHFGGGSEPSEKTPQQHDVSSRAGR